MKAGDGQDREPTTLTALACGLLMLALAAGVALLVLALTGTGP